MKALISYLTISLFIVSVLTAKQTDPLNDSANCRTYLLEIDPELPQSEQVRIDLLQGQWNTSDAIQWDFHADGRLYHINTDASGAQELTTSKWDVKMYDAFTVLYISHDDNPGIERYMVEQTCDGVELNNIDDDTNLVLDFEKPDFSTRKKAQSTILGHWENALSPDQIAAIPALNRGGAAPHKARIAFDFMADGSFVQLIHCMEYQITFETRGTWAISKDGKTLLMSDLSQVDKARCIEIQYLELDEMVLRNLVPATAAQNMKKSYYFNKY